MTRTPTAAWPHAAHRPGAGSHLDRPRPADRPGAGRDRRRRDGRRAGRRASPSPSPSATATDAAAARREASQAESAVDAVDVVPSGDPGPLPADVARADGRVVPEPAATPGSTGTSGSWAADIGDRVKQGQVLATIDTPELDQQLLAAQGQGRRQSDAMVDVAKSNENIAKLTYDRWRDSPKGVVSEQEREQKQADYAAAKARLTEARAQAQLDRADVGRYQALEAFRKVTAPYDGVITARNDRHRRPGRGRQLGQRQAAVHDGPVEPDPGASSTSPQKAASADMIVGLAARRDQRPVPRPGVRRQGRPVGHEHRPQTRTERVEVDVPNPDLTLIPGMYVQVDVPAEPARPAGGAGRRHPVPARRAAGGRRPARRARSTFRPVTVAKDDGDTVELADGVRPGDRVALNISSAVTPGQHGDGRSRTTPTTRRRRRPPPSRPRSSGWSRPRPPAARPIARRRRNRHPPAGPRHSGPQARRRPTSGPGPSRPRPREQGRRLNHVTPPASADRLTPRLASARSFPRHPFSPPGVRAVAKRAG